MVFGLAIHTHTKQTQPGQNQHCKQLNLRLVILAASTHIHITDKVCVIQ